MLTIDRLVSRSAVSNACKAGLLIALAVLTPACAISSESLDDEDLDLNPVPAHTMASGEMSTSQAPTQLWVTTNSTSNSGTSNAITLRYWNKSGKYSCTISSGIDDGEQEGCTPTRYGDYSSSPDVFKVGYADADERSDGLLVTAVSARINHIEYRLETFTMYWSAISCTGCSGLLGDESCNSCWIDGDDHDRCVEMKIEMQSGQANIQCTKNI